MYWRNSIITEYVKLQDLLFKKKSTYYTLMGGIRLKVKKKKTQKKPQNNKHLLATLLEVLPCDLAPFLGG